MAVLTSIIVEVNLSIHKMFWKTSDYLEIPKKGFELVAECMSIVIFIFSFMHLHNYLINKLKIV